MADFRSLVSPIMVGRDDLLDLADRRIRDVTAGGGHALLVAGEAGLGKTRLIAAIERRAIGSGFAVVRGATYPSDLQVPGAVLIDLARAMGRSSSPVLVAIGARLERRLADADLDPEQVPAGRGDPHRRRRLLVLDTAELLSAVASDGPAAIVLEDLHWADDLTLEIVEALIRLVPGRRLLLLGTYRSDELYPRVPVREWRARLLARRQAEEVRLVRLGLDDTATVVRLLLGSPKPVGRDIVAAIHERTDGIPLHIEELVGLLADVEDLDDAAVRRADVPETVEAAITARIARRSAAALSVAQAGAVVGRAFDLDLLATVMDADPAALAPALEELASNSILVLDRQTGRSVFRHALIGDVVYEGLSVPERRRLHARVAEAATARTDIGTDAFLSLQFERAGRFAEAFRFACAGAAAATAISSHGEARSLYECALRTAPPDLSGPERAGLLEALAGSAAATDDNAAASASFEAAESAYRAAGMVLEAADMVARLVDVRHLLGDGLESRVGRLRAALADLAVGAPAVGLVPDQALDRVRARLSAALSAAYMLDRRLDEAIEEGRNALLEAASAGDVAIERHASITLGACYVFAGRAHEGWPLLESALRASQAAHLEAEAARAYRMIGTSASVLVDYERAESWLREGIDYAERVGLWNHRHYMAAHLGHVLWATGRWDEADAIAKHALADGRGGITTRITALIVIGYVALGRGQLDTAEEALGEARDLGAAMAELQRFSPPLWGLAELALTSGDAALAIERCEAGLAASAAVEDAAYLFPYLVTGTRAYLALADVQGAKDWLARTGPRILARSIAGTLPAVDHAGGLIALAEGSTLRAREALADAARRWAASGRIWEGTWATVDLARAHLRANQGAAAARIAQAAGRRAQDLGAPALQSAAAAVTRPDGEPPAPWAPLTVREFEVARLVAAGSTNVEVAESLGVARKTVASHIEHILIKLDVRNRAEIAVWAARIQVAGTGDAADR